ncbi:hypothetical protein LK542_10075 [Massilia sp. IC2-477]|uniref:hypothetical protein n=1 Tax=unclassified Massilia TaxID=2609279 RepID=UPI001D12FEC0|nr:MULTISPECIES: hypothetical protein [unclassified Massilia]MCC2955960.1 hypothetical protein [Massilia sp. IC2-477]MCC2970543.1 hypothetical protein [Massilia sp. IC2-476]
MSMSCDRVGNLLLVKFSSKGARDLCIYVPAFIVFWLLRHLPVNQDPNLAAPPAAPQITQQDWDNPYTPRAQYVQCKELRGALRMTFVLDSKEDLTVVLDRSNVELMRQVMAMYTKDLIDLDAQ